MECARGTYRVVNERRLEGWASECDLRTLTASLHALGSGRYVQVDPSSYAFQDICFIYTMSCSQVPSSKGAPASIGARMSVGVMAPACS